LAVVVPETKWLPLMLSVNAGPPATALLGLRLVMAGVAAKASGADIRARPTGKIIANHRMKVRTPCIVTTSSCREGRIELIPERLVKDTALLLIASECDVEHSKEFNLKLQACVRVTVLIPIFDKS
jgi:hypothetical protein